MKLVEKSFLFSSILKLHKIKHWLEYFTCYACGHKFVLVSQVLASVMKPTSVTLLTTFLHSVTSSSRKCSWVKKYFFHSTQPSNLGRPLLLPSTMSIIVSSSHSIMSSDCGGRNVIVSVLLPLMPLVSMVVKSGLTQKHQLATRDCVPRNSYNFPLTTFRKHAFPFCLLFLHCT